MLTALYRHFDADGVLLYVGISLRPVQRLGTHAKGSRWADRITRVTVEWRESREAAMRAESVAIRDELPSYNITGQVEARRPPRVKLAKVPLQPRKPLPPEPSYVDSPEKVAAHFSVGIHMVSKWVKSGMPREQISTRRFRYELGACQDWLLERGRQRDAETKAASDAAKKAADKVMAEAMQKAIASIGRRAPP